MIDLRPQLQDLKRKLTSRKIVEGGQVVMFISARQGEGTSSIAASFGLVAAERVQKPAWLVDLNLKANHLFNAFAVGPYSKIFGGVGRPYSACLRSEPFFSVESEEGPVTVDPAWFTAHRIGETRLMVTQFDGEQLEKGQTLRIRTRPEYWSLVRQSTDWAIVNAPALEQSAAGLAVASQMDAVILVVQADQSTPDEVDVLRREIERHGGNVAGVVMNRVRADARFFDGLAR